MYKNKSMNWDTLIRICLAFIIFIIQESGGSPDAVSTGSNEAPWMWMSTGNDLNENNSGTEVLEVVELIEDTHVMTAPIELNTEPRFVGHLRRKLCKVGLGIGDENGLNCDHVEISSPKIFRSKRSPSPQFIRINEDDLDDADRAPNLPLDLDQKGGRSVEGPPSGRFFGGAGLDGLGLNNLLNPHISPSVGVHFGAIPYGYGGHYGGHYGSPFQFNLGPLSINPFGGLRFSLHNGRPHIRPTLDLLITPNKKRNAFDFNPYHSNNGHYNNYYNDYSNRFSRDAKQSRPSVLKHRDNHSRNPLAKLLKPFLPKLGKALNPNHHSSDGSELAYLNHPNFEGGEIHQRQINDGSHSHHNANFPTHKKVVFSENSGTNHRHPNPIKTVESPLLSYGRSDSKGESLRDDRDDIYRKES